MSNLEPPKKIIEPFGKLFDISEIDKEVLASCFELLIKNLRGRELERYIWEGGDRPEWLDTELSEERRNKNV